MRYLVYPEAVRLYISRVGRSMPRFSPESSGQIDDCFHRRLTAVRCQTEPGLQIFRSFYFQFYG